MGQAVRPQYRLTKDMEPKTKDRIGAWPKRTPLPARTKPLKRTPIVKYSGPQPGGGPYPLKRTPVRKKRKGERRVSVVRDPAYKKDLVSREGCSVGNQVHRIASRGNCDPAHGPVNGMGSKGGDDGIITLCRLHHAEQHAIGWPAFETKYGIDRAVLSASNYARFKQETGK